MSEQPTVVVVGGGYGGNSVAKALDDVAQVVLVEPKDRFQHAVASLRALVDPQWTEEIFLPYDHLLQHGRVVRDRAVEVDEHGVLLGSGERLVADYVVLATGSRYPFPAKSDQASTEEAVAHYRAMYDNLAGAQRVMLLGAGAVGLELAGEISAAWPDKQITLVDMADEILPGPYSPSLRTEIEVQLDKAGVTRVLGSPLVAPPTIEPGTQGAVSVTTVDGRTVEADIWFRCYGVVPVTEYLAGSLAAARTPEGYLSVTADLRVQGSEHVYAVGDINAVDANKAGVASRQAQVVVANIRARIEGSDEVSTYTVAPPGILLPFGPTGGAGQRFDTGEIVPAEVVSKLKGGAMMLDRYREMLNIPAQ